MENTKIYLLKHNLKSYQFWFSWSPDSGSTFDMDATKLSFRTNKSSDLSFDGNVDEIVENWSTKNTPVKKIGDTSIFKIPVFEYKPYSSARDLEVWGGDVKPINYGYMSIDTNEFISVINFFKTLKEAISFKKGYCLKGNTNEGEQWIDEGVVPAKVYKSKTLILHLIRKLLEENGTTILDGRKISDLSEKDLFEIGYNHFEIHNLNDKYANGATIKGGIFNYEIGGL